MIKTHSAKYHCGFGILKKSAPNRAKSSLSSSASADAAVAGSGSFAPSVAVAGAASASATSSAKGKELLCEFCLISRNNFEWVFVIQILYTYINTKHRSLNYG